MVYERRRSPAAETGEIEMTFTLDTSGAVKLPRTFPGERVHVIAWPDLDPFTQGFMLAASEAVAWQTGKVIRFRDWSTEALAMILADCAAATSWQWTLLSAQMMGASFWQNRQRGDYGPLYPPLTVSLGDDGKVRLS
jgi:hypothetical protein